MKQFVGIFIALIFAPILYAAVSVEDVARLSELSTGDELIIQLIKQEGLTRPLSTTDVIQLRERGVNERVIEAMLSLSKSQLQTLTEEEAAELRSKTNVRSYYTTGKTGKKILTATNLDENGNRMGPPAPPAPEPEPQQAYTPPPEPREIIVTVRREDERRYQDPYQYEDEYYPPYDYGGGIPAYGYPSYGYPAYDFPGYIPAPYRGYTPSSNFNSQNAFHVNPFGATGNYNFNRPVYVPRHSGRSHSGFKGHRGGHSRGSSNHSRGATQRPMTSGVKR